jgi:hypothetical protein
MSATLPGLTNPRGSTHTAKPQGGGKPTPAIHFITFCGGTVTAVPPARVLDSWDISDHFPVVAKLPGLTRTPDQGDVPPRPATLGRRIVMEDPMLKDRVASSNYWQPLFDSMVDEAEEALGSAPISPQEQLNGMAEKYTDTCHQVAEQLNLHQRLAGQAPPRVAARVRKAINRRRAIFKELRQAESQGCQDRVAEIAARYKAAQVQARKVIRTT